MNPINGYRLMLLQRHGEFSQIRPDYDLFVYMYPMSICSLCFIVLYFVRIGQNVYPIYIY